MRPLGVEHALDSFPLHGLNHANPFWKKDPKETAVVVMVSMPVLKSICRGEKFNEKLPSSIEEVAALASGRTKL